MLFGVDLTFYDLLEQQANCAIRAAQAFHTYVKDFPGSVSALQSVKDIEHEADLITHQLANKVDSTFVTPLDKEDLHNLSNRLDDVTDFELSDLAEHAHTLVQHGTDHHVRAGDFTSHLVAPSRVGCG